MVISFDNNMGFFQEVNRLKELKSEIYSHDHISLLDYCKAWMFRKKAMKKLKRINGELNDLLSKLNDKPIPFDADHHQLAKSLLFLLKDIYAENKGTILTNAKMDELQETNIDMAYKFERIVRKSAYSKKEGQPTEQHPFASAISKYSKSVSAPNI